MAFRITAFAALLALGTFALPPTTKAHASEGAEDRVWRTTTSLLGESRYQNGFEHYDHVNPDAPKGGTLNVAALGSYDSFNPFIVQGDAAAGLNYQGGLLWDTLMEKAIDEPSASHPLIAEAYTYPDDYSSATYRLDPRARWHDGKPITAADVKFSMEMMKEHSPQYNRYFANIVEMTIDSEREITFTFDQKGNRELPLIIGDLPVIPKHWWEGTDAEGKKRDFNRSTLEPPLGSGPYRIGTFEAGTNLTYERVEDYWAKDTPTRKGRFNFDKRRYVYFTDENAIWQAFQKGGLTDIRAENRAQRWATEYDFPAAKDGLVKREAFPDESTYTMQGWVLNTRRPLFQDRRVRKALTWAFNFERMNKNLFYDQYARTKTYFGGSELSSTGMPEGRELEILEEYRGRIPDEIFTQPFELPVYESRSDDRKHLRTAFDLLQQAGWESQGGKLINKATGQAFEFEILGFSPASERVNAPWINALRKLGIEATFRVVDGAQFQARVNDFDYDVISIPTRQSQSPGNEQREYWSSKAADQKGSRNYMGAKDPVIDELVERIVFAKDRAELVAVTRALDRLLLFQYYTVPQWHLSLARIAWWDKFGIPRPQPTYVGADIESWWIVPEKAAALGNDG